MNNLLKGVILTPFNLLYRISPEIELKIIFRLKCGYRLNLKSPKTYNELLDDGYRMYFCVLLFSTIKNFSLIMFIAASLNLIK